MTLNLNELVRGGTFCLTKAGLAAGSSTDGMRTNDPSGASYFNFCINGIMYSCEDADNNVDFTASTQTALYSCLYVCCIASDNTITVVAGTEVLTADVTSGKKVLHWPAPTADTCAFGGVKVVATAVFTAGTTALGTGNTATYYDFFAVPATPITS